MLPRASKQSASFITFQCGSSGSKRLVRRYGLSEYRARRYACSRESTQGLTKGQDQPSDVDQRIVEGQGSKGWDKEALRPLPQSRRSYANARRRNVWRADLPNSAGMV